MQRDTSTRKRSEQETQKQTHINGMTALMGACASLCPSVTLCSPIETAQAKTVKFLLGSAMGV